MLSLLVLFTVHGAIATTEEGACESRRQSLQPLFETHYRTYNQDHYMSLWCVRNSENLYRALRRDGLAEPSSSFAVYMIHSDADSSLFPRTARYQTRRWSNHAFLVIDGFVLDQDFESAPRIVSLDSYLSSMWQGQTQQAIFQIRPADKIAGYTNYEVRESIRRGEYLVTDLTGLVLFFEPMSCSHAHRSGENAEP